MPQSINSMSKYITRRAARGNGICPVLQKWRLSSIFSFIWREFSKRLVAPRNWENEERNQREREMEKFNQLFSLASICGRQKDGDSFVPTGKRRPTGVILLDWLFLRTDNNKFFSSFSRHIYFSL